MKYCTSCGQPIDDNAKFCTYCGALQPNAAGQTAQENQSQSQDHTSGQAQNWGQSYNQGQDWNQTGNQWNQNQNQNWNQAGNQWDQPQGWNPQTPQWSEQPQTNQKGLVIVAYLLGWIGFIIALIAGDKNDPFLKFHLNQILVIDLFELVCFIPYLGWVWAIFMIVCWLIAFVGACQGKMNPAPLIGQIHILDR